MAEIQMVHRKGYCDLDESEYSIQCHTCWGEEMPCGWFAHPKHEPNVIPFGDCVHAKIRYIYEGIVAKKYLMELDEDSYNPHLNCMEVTAGGETYHCEKVILNGECIYNEMEDDTNA